ncbi:MAG: pyridoxamine 5'-phosphate oxidase family protein [Candidatus Schekmanbacteria bacterium]|nr:pyridoxamine 5'-phosphate oxidase family protein [Candidatus Schekmanbacteria bacterium]
MKGKMDKEKLEKEIIEFLNENSSRKGTLDVGCGLAHGSACALATCRNNKPRNTPVDFFSEGLVLWIGAEPGEKVVNIKENPSVSVTVYKSVGDHSATNKSMQYFGNAALITKKNNEKLYLEKFREFGMYDSMGKMVDDRIKRGELPESERETFFEKVLNAFSLIRIEPEKIIYLYLEPEKSAVKYTWTKKE